MKIQNTCLQTAFQCFTVLAIQLKKGILFIVYKNIFLTLRVIYKKLVSCA